MTHNFLTLFHPQYSDRVGRRPVLGISALAALLTDIVFIMTTLRANKVPNGYNLFILCSAIYGNVILCYSFGYLSDAYGMRLDDKDLLVELLLT